MQRPPLYFILTLILGAGSVLLWTLALTSSPQGDRNEKHIPEESLAKSMVETQNKVDKIEVLLSTRLKSVEKRLALVEIENQKLSKVLEQKNSISQPTNSPIQAELLSTSVSILSENTSKKQPVITGEDIRQAFLLERIKEQHDKQWSDFKPNLNVSKKVKLDELLLQYEIDIETLQRNLRRANPQERDSIAKELAEQEVALKNNIASEFGQETAIAYENYSKTLPVRAKIDNLSIDSDQRESLVRVMMDVNAQKGWEEPVVRPSVRSMSVEERQAYIKNIKDINQAYLSSSSAVLTPDAHAQFQQSLDRQVQRTEVMASGNMARRAGLGPQW